MRRILTTYIFLITAFLLWNCKTPLKYNTVLHSDKSIAYEGRIGTNTENTASEIYWPGTSIKINFEGTEVKTTLEDQGGTNYFNIIIDGVPSLDILKLEKGKKTYVIASHLSNSKHSIELTKRNGWTYGRTLFYSFEIKGNLLKKDPEKHLFIEYYGDSITTGHGNEDYTGEDKPDGDVSNNYITYAAITARNINAEYSCIARSGIGIMVSWFNMIMPEMYYRLDPSNENSTWDFSTKQPDIVVINLFQNDSWIVNRSEHKEFIRRFGDKKPNEEKIVSDYSNFVKTIREKYTDASIVCLLGNMDITKDGSPWPNYVKSAIEKLKDQNIMTCFVPYKDTPGHPKVEEHKVIAEKLTRLIQQKILKY